MNRTRRRRCRPRVSHFPSPLLRQAYGGRANRLSMSRQTVGETASSPWPSPPEEERGSARSDFARGQFMVTMRVKKRRGSPKERGCSSDNCGNDASGREDRITLLPYIEEAAGENSVGR